MDAINPDHYKRLPAEAIDIIESAIDKAPSNKDAYLHGQVLKYILRCWNKNGIEDLKKAKWYLDRLIQSFDESNQQPSIKQPTTTEPPDGWRYLEVGEVIRKGDQGFEKNLFHAIEPIKIGMTLQAHWMPTIRRNKFEVGEKVVENTKQRIGVVKEKIGCVESPFEYRVEMLDTKGDRYFFPHHLAPYIEETK